MSRLIAGQCPLLRIVYPLRLRVAGLAIARYGSHSESYSVSGTACPLLSVRYCETSVRYGLACLILRVRLLSVRYCETFVRDDRIIRSYSE